MGEDKAFERWAMQAQDRTRDMLLSQEAPTERERVDCLFRWSITGGSQF